MNTTQLTHAQLAAMDDPDYFPIFGAERTGTSTRGDVLVSHTSDGTDLGSEQRMSCLKA